jgi:hypothetical protein
MQIREVDGRCSGQHEAGDEREHETSPVGSSPMPSRGKRFGDSGRGRHRLFSGTLFENAIATRGTWPATLPLTRSVLDPEGRRRFSCGGPSRHRREHRAEACPRSWTRPTGARAWTSPLARRLRPRAAGRWVRAPRALRTRGGANRLEPDLWGRSMQPPRSGPNALRRSSGCTLPPALAADPRPSAQRAESSLLVTARHHARNTPVRAAQPAAARTEPQRLSSRLVPAPSPKENAGITA